MYIEHKKIVTKKSDQEKDAAMMTIWTCRKYDEDMMIRCVTYLRVLVLVITQTH